MRMSAIVSVCVPLVVGWGCSSGAGGGSDQATDLSAPDALTEVAADAALDKGGTDAAKDVVAPDAVVDAAPDTPGDPAAEASQDVVPTTKVTVRMKKSDGTPVTGFKVALDWPDGTRLTGVVGADGKVELPGWDGAPGVYVAMAWIDPWVAPNQFLAGRFAATGASEIVIVSDGAAAAPGFVTVSGTANL